MIPILAFSFVAAGLVYVAGRKDAARDPRLTVSLLLLLAGFPLMALWMPKIGVFPAAGARDGDLGMPWGVILTIIWAAGFAVGMFRLLVAWLVLRTWRKRSVTVAWAERIPVRVSPDTSGPIASGILKPVILVPPSWHAWPEDYRRTVLAHEIAHHRRRDPLWRLLGHMVCSLYWFHPLVRWMMRRFLMQCEFACDAMVLGSGIDPKRYACVLCDFAESRPPSPLASGMAESCPLESRVRRMLTPATLPRNRWLAALGALGMLAAGAFAMVGRAPDATKPTAADDIRLRLAADPFPGNAD